jgi:asparagine synthase (glutamine-hydrolysing)
MSIIFGIRARNAQLVTEGQLETLAETTVRHAHDGTFLRAKARVAMGFQPYCTHERSRLEAQPLTDAEGNMLCFDGRLDNHSELRKALDRLDGDAPDSEIVLAAFARWGEACFARFVGDWALAFWSHAENALYLARDHAGTRTLYYEATKDRILWGTYLETFLETDEFRDLDEAYVARYLACQPIRELTPYHGIRAVPPAHYVRITDTKITQKEHWSWLIKEEIQFKTDTDYEEQFFALFKHAVERRTGFGAPILAQLSGGMDSSSIVCMSDHLRRQQGAAPSDLLDTVSYFDEAEPNWNEKPFFEAVERDRGKSGIHLPYPLLSPRLEGAPVRSLWPGADHAAFENELHLIETTASSPHRVLLAGIGGDELLGGVPTPLPELGDLLVTGRGIRYLRRAVDWCLVDRTPLLAMTGQTLRFIGEQLRQPCVKNEMLPSWIKPALRKELEWANQVLDTSPFPFSIRPSHIANARTGLAVLETLPVRPPRSLRRYEMRYPYLDRDLVDFLLRVPRERLLKPGRRRALMRCALEGVVPHEVLERRRKGTRSRSVLRTLQKCEREIRQLFRNSSQWMQEMVDSRLLEDDAIKAIRQSDMTKMPALLRAIHFHMWDETHRSSSNIGPRRAAS